MPSGQCTPGRPALGHNRDFIRLWTGGAVSGLGSALGALAYPLLALSVTRSAGQAGLVGLVTLAAATLIRLPAGSLVDRLPLRRVLVGADLVRVVSTAALAISVATGHLALWQLVVVGTTNAGAAVFSEIAHSVAVRHVVPAAQLPAAFALNEGRGHAISLAGQPIGGVLYGVASALPLVADLASFVVSAVVSATITDPMRPAARRPERSRLWSDLFTGLAFLRHEPILRATLLAASGYQLVYAAATFALIANFTATGATPADLGILFAVAAVGGIVGAITAPLVQARLRLGSVVMLMGWTAAAVFASFAWVDRPLLAGALLGCIFITSAPANAILLATQITRTPSHLRGRVMAASFLIAGLVAPLGSPLGGVLLDTTSQRATFLAIAALTGLITVGVHLNQPLRTLPRPK